MRTNNTVSAVLRQKFCQKPPDRSFVWNGLQLEYWQILCKLHLGLQSIFCEWQGEIIGPCSDRKRLKTGWPLDMVKEQVVMVLATCTTVSCQSKKPQSQQQVTNHHGGILHSFGFVLSNFYTYIKVNIIWNFTTINWCCSSFWATKARRNSFNLLWKIYF